MRTLFRGGLVFDGAGGKLEAHGVLVEGRHIRRVAPLAEFDGYADAMVDTSGETPEQSFAKLLDAVIA